jgi:hypothetical protein
MELTARSRRASWRDYLWLLRLVARSRWDARFGVSVKRSDSSPLGPPRSTQLPKRLWLYWEQGWDKAPELVRTCASSWQAHNPDWDVELLDGETAERLTGMVSFMAGKQAARAATANMVRLSLLTQFGGAWVDATTLCTASLRTWLGPLMQSGFFAFSRPGPDRLLSTWFLAAEPEHPLVSAWLDRCLRYWRLMSRPHLYFWVAHIFAGVLREDRALNRLWRLTPQIAAAPSLELQKHWGAASFAATAKTLEALAVPLHKLDWRLPFSPADCERLRDVTSASAQSHMSEARWAEFRPG